MSEREGDETMTTTGFPDLLGATDPAAESRARTQRVRERDLKEPA